MHYQFVDCRWELADPRRGRELYLQGHIPGASFLDVDTDLSGPPGPAGRHPLPAAEEFAHAARRAGIGPGVFVVAYGNMGGAERLWWLLRHFGHEGSAVIELASWRGPLSGGEEQVEPRGFDPSPRSDDTIDATELARHLEDTVVVDARVATSRTRSTGSRAASPARSTRRGTSPCPRFRQARSSPTAGRA
jgi:thiosulfate/3-mercaptopyruvate sulfurtransferase